MGINLVTKQKKYLRFEKIFETIRVVLIVATGIFFVSAIISFYFLFVKNQQLEQLMAEKKTLLQYLNVNKEVEAEFIYFRNKQKQLISIINEDVNFFPYYHLITESLKSASPEPKLDTIVISKNREINFTLSFDDSNSMIIFLKTVESDTFLKNFSQLRISQLNIEQKKEAKSFQLNLIGKLNPVNETEN